MTSAGIYRSGTKILYYDRWTEKSVVTSSKTSPNLVVKSKSLDQGYLLSNLIRERERE